MDRLIATLPKTLLAIIILVGGLFLLRQFQPPVTICDAQLKNFHDSQEKFLFTAPAVNEIVKKSKVQVNLERCRSESSPGACFDLFEGLKKFAGDLYDIPTSCAEAAAGQKEISQTLWGALKLMVQVAWGEKPPVSYTQKNSWFDSSELALFCGLRSQAKRLFGDEAFAEWQNGLLNSFPGADKLTREQVWPLTILSTPCDLYR